MYLNNNNNNRQYWGKALVAHNLPNAFFILFLFRDAQILFANDTQSSIANMKYSFLEQW